MRVVSSLSLAFIVLSSFFSFGCFLRFAVGLFWLRFVLVSDLFVADCILFSAVSLFVWSGNIWFSCCLRLEMASASVLEFICCSWISSWRRSCSAFWQILLYAVVHLVLLGAVAGTGDQLDRQEFWRQIPRESAFLGTWLERVPMASDCLPLQRQYQYRCWHWSCLLCPCLWRYFKIFIHALSDVTEGHTYSMQFVKECCQISLFICENFDQMDGIQADQDVTLTKFHAMSTGCVLCGLEEKDSRNDVLVKLRCENSFQAIVT